MSFSWVVLQRIEKYPVQVFPWTQAFRSLEEARGAVEFLAERNGWEVLKSDETGVWIKAGEEQRSYTFHRVMAGGPVEVIAAQHPECTVEVIEG